MFVGSIKSPVYSRNESSVEMRIYWVYTIAVPYEGYLTATAPAR
jgi:hypothetical protein